MSDFYQILKREIEPERSPSNPTNNGEVLKTEKEPVENLSQKNNISLDKKNIPITRAVKNRPIASKKPSRARLKNKREKKIKSDSGFLSLEPANPIWLTMAETAKLGGVQKRTIKRALRSGHLKYRIIDSRYQVDLRSALIYFFSKKKLWNKLKESGIGQYVEKWRN
jgi:hypothetical protein